MSQMLEWLAEASEEPIGSLTIQKCADGRVYVKAIASLLKSSSTPKVNGVAQTTIDDLIQECQNVPNISSKHYELIQKALGILDLGIEITQDKIQELQNGGFGMSIALIQAMKRAAQGPPPVPIPEMRESGSSTVSSKSKGKTKTVVKRKKDVKRKRKKIITGEERPKSKKASDSVPVNVSEPEPELVVDSNVVKSSESQPKNDDFVWNDDSKDVDTVNGEIAVDNVSNEVVDHVESWKDELLRLIGEEQCHISNLETDLAKLGMQQAVDQVGVVRIEEPENPIEFSSEVDNSTLSQQPTKSADPIIKERERSDRGWVSYSVDVGRSGFAGLPTQVAKHPRHVRMPRAAVVNVKRPSDDNNEGHPHPEREDSDRIQLLERERNLLKLEMEQQRQEMQNRILELQQQMEVEKRKAAQAALEDVARSQVEAKLSAAFPERSASPIVPPDDPPSVENTRLSSSIKQATLSDTRMSLNESLREGELDRLDAELEGSNARARFRLSMERASLKDHDEKKKLLQQLSEAVRNISPSAERAEEDLNGNPLSHSNWSGQDKGNDEKESGLPKWAQNTETLMEEGVEADPLHETPSQPALENDQFQWGSGAFFTVDSEPKLEDPEPEDQKVQYDPVNDAAALLDRFDPSSPEYKRAVKELEKKQRHYDAIKQRMSRRDEQRKKGKQTESNGIGIDSENHVEMMPVLPSPKTVAVSHVVVDNMPEPVENNEDDSLMWEDTAGPPMPKKHEHKSYRKPDAYIRPSVGVATSKHAHQMARGRSNRVLIQNALSHMFLAGKPNEKERLSCLQAMSDWKASDLFLILLKGHVAPLRFKGIFAYTSNNEIVKIAGQGVSSIDPDTVSACFKYDSGSRGLNRLDTEHLTRTTDAVAIRPSKRHIVIRSGLENR